MLTLAAWSQVDTGPPINTSIDDPDNQRFKEDDFRMLYMKVGLPCLPPEQEKRGHWAEDQAVPTSKARYNSLSVCRARSR